MNRNSSVKARIAISLLPKLNSCIYLPLIERCGGLEGFFLESDQALNQLYRELNIPTDTFNRKTAIQNSEAEIEQLDKHEIQICTIEDGCYPELLRQCADAPLVFFYKGKLKSSPANKYLAIVGTRHASSRCEARVTALVEDLVNLGCRPVLVSGLAYGIDASAHRASLKFGLTTLAVLGHGLHMIYPATHKSMARQILETGGAWISEFPCTANIHPSNFLRRNRIIAGLCHATLVAESAIKGGAMATARLAMSYDREVMAFPGRPEDKYSAGCNFLIKENIAALTENATDVAHLFGYPIKKTTLQQTILPNFSDDEQGNTLIQLLSENGALHIDELCQLTQRPSSELAAILLQLELEGKIIGLAGKKYSLRYFYHSERARRSTNFSFSNRLSAGIYLQLSIRKQNQGLLIKN